MAIDPEHGNASEDGSEMEPETRSAASVFGNNSSHIILVPGMRPVADYELVKQLGRGGFGEVWKANGPGGFEVALKFILLGDMEAKVESRSLELIKGIRHPHLLSFFGAWEKKNYLIVAMELADRTLSDRLKEIRSQGGVGIPRSELLGYLEAAAKGIDYLNAQGIQHRDIKPQNLLLVGGGVKVADFGLAKLLEQSFVSASGSMTAAYAPPEFFNGQASHWSDQYSLAVSYCQLRGGKLPFTGNSAEIMAGHLARLPDLKMLPEAERAVVVRALAKQPKDRWPNCVGFVRELTKLRSGFVIERPDDSLEANDQPAKVPEASYWQASTVAFKPKISRRQEMFWSSRRFWIGTAVVVLGLGSFAAIIIAAAWLWAGNPTREKDRP